MKVGTKPKLLVILGPTASGKTDLAVALAKKFRGEIISADSRQFYRGTDIGSDIIPGRWVKRGGRTVYVAMGIPHHLISFRSPAKSVTVGEFKRLAERKISEIVRRGRLPILCGGSGLYIRAVADNYTIPEVPPNPKLCSALDKIPLAKLYRELKKKDPAYASRIPPSNRRYVTRALEVMAATGRPFSSQQSMGEPKYEVMKLGIRRSRPEIYRRIEARVDEQMKRGLLDEARRLGRRYGWSLPSITGLGHRQLGLFLEGKVSLGEAVSLIKRDTRHFSKRQLTWFRREKGVKWVKNQAEAERAICRFWSNKA
jgi:tRNA dimethylallyltransferase